MKYFSYMECFTSSWLYLKKKAHEKLAKYFLPYYTIFTWKLFDKIQYVRMSLCMHALMQTHRIIKGQKLETQKKLLSIGSFAEMRRPLKQDFYSTMVGINVKRPETAADNVKRTQTAADLCREKWGKKKKKFAHILIIHVISTTYIKLSLCK